jgi:hypothetical protein
LPAGWTTKYWSAFTTWSWSYHFSSSNGILGVARWTSCHFGNARWVLVPLNCAWHVILNPCLALVSLSFLLCSPCLHLTSCLFLPLALSILKLLFLVFHLFIFLFCLTPVMC